MFHKVSAAMRTTYNLDVKLYFCTISLCLSNVKYVEKPNMRVTLIAILIQLQREYLSPIFKSKE